MKKTLCIASITFFTLFNIDAKGQDFDPSRQYDFSSSESYAKYKKILSKQ